MSPQVRCPVCCNCKYHQQNVINTNPNIRPLKGKNNIDVQTD